MISVIRCACLAVAGFSLFPAFSAWSSEIQTTFSLSPKMALTELAKQVSDPASTRFRKYFTAAEIRAKAGPTAAEHQKLVEAITARGLRVKGETKDGLFITVSGDASAYEQAFGVRITTDSKGSRTLSSPPKIPREMGLVAGISGLASTSKRVARYKLRKNGSVSQTPLGYSPAEIKKFYHIDEIEKTGANGVGQDIAIATYDDVSLYNVQLYYLFNKINPLPIVDKIPVSGTPMINEFSAIETSLDAEFTGMMAPGANVHVFTSADNSEGGELALFNAILDDGRAPVVNYSWGMCEQYLSAQHFSDMQTVFARAVAQGVNVFVASGDSGAVDCYDANGNPQPGLNFPSSDPNVISVGGTSIEDYNHVTIEAGWSGSGGGTSLYYAAPAYQASLKNAHRMNPDVSFNADPDFGQSIYLTFYGLQGFYEIGGTSMAAPQWVGLITLVNAARAKLLKKPVGFLNPILYGLSASSYGENFNDILYGDNGGYVCTAGWDGVTGLGSPKGKALFDTLVAF